MNKKMSVMNTCNGWRFVLALLLCCGSTSVFSQNQIVYHSFNSGFSSSTGNNSILSSTLGQTIFGVSASNGILVFTGYSAFSKGVLSSIKIRSENVPVEFALYQNYPNPFNPSTTIRYGLPSPSRVSIRIFNILGQHIAEIVNKEQSEGSYEITWRADVASGLYFYRIDAVSMTDPTQKYSQLKKMILLK